MYEVFFEVSLCLMINFTVVDMTKADLNLNWIITMIISINTTMFDGPTN